MLEVYRDRSVAKLSWSTPVAPGVNAVRMSSRGFFSRLPKRQMRSSRYARKVRY